MQFWNLNRQFLYFLISWCCYWNKSKGLALLIIQKNISLNLLLALLLIFLSSKGEGGWRFRICLRVHIPLNILKKGTQFLETRVHMTNPSPSPNKTLNQFNLLFHSWWNEIWFSFIKNNNKIRNGTLYVISWCLDLTSDLPDLFVYISSRGYFPSKLLLSCKGS